VRLGALRQIEDELEAARRRVGMRAAADEIVEVSVSVIPQRDLDRRSRVAILARLLDIASVGERRKRAPVGHRGKRLLVRDLGGQDGLTSCAGALTLACGEKQEAGDKGPKIRNRRQATGDWKQETGDPGAHASLLRPGCPVSRRLLPVACLLFSEIRGVVVSAFTDEWVDTQYVHDYAHIMSRAQTTPSRQDRAAQRVVEALDSDFLRALAEPARVEILKLLVLHGPSDISEIAARLPQDRSVLSRHLQTLLRAGVVKCAKDGRRRIYNLQGSAFVGRLDEMLSSVRGLVALCCPPGRD